MEIKILMGLPMSGKSTIAKKMISNFENCIIIECDEIRKMITGKDDKYDAFNINNEKIVWDTFNFMVNKSIEENKNIIISNTNLNLKKLNELLLLINNRAEIEIMLIDTPVDICISRLNDKDKHMIPIIEKMNIQMIETLKWLENEHIMYRLKGGV